MGAAAGAALEMEAGDVADGTGEAAGDAGFAGSLAFVSPVFIGSAPVVPAFEVRLLTSSPTVGLGAAGFVSLLTTTGAGAAGFGSSRTLIGVLLVVGALARVRSGDVVAGTLSAFWRTRLP
jgi:hypothetical protein